MCLLVMKGANQLQRPGHQAHAGACAANKALLTRGIAGSAFLALQRGRRSNQAAPSVGDRELNAGPLRLLGEHVRDLRRMPGPRSRRLFVARHRVSASAATLGAYRDGLQNRVGRPRHERDQGAFEPRLIGRLHGLRAYDVAQRSHQDYEQVGAKRCALSSLNSTG